jgi:hypothetical protein
VSYFKNFEVFFSHSLANEKLGWTTLQNLHQPFRVLDVAIADVVDELKKIVFVIVVNLDFKKLLLLQI